MRSLAPALLLLTSCVGAPEPRPEQRAAGAAALQGWLSAGLPEPDKGRCDVRAFRVRIDSAERFFQDCHTVPSAAYGCLVFDSTDEWFRWRRVPVVVIAPWWHSEPSIIVHELCHAMETCAGMPPDPKHLDKRVWSAAGGDTSAQSRALKLLE